MCFAKLPLKTNKIISTKIKRDQTAKSIMIACFRKMFNRNLTKIIIFVSELRSIKLNRKLGETWMHRAAITNSEVKFTNIKRIFRL